MCRLLAVKSEKEFSITHYLETFAETCRKNSEYQGHGWGCAFLQDNKWKLHKEIKPIWESDFSSFKKTKLLIAHARSAFRNEGIKIENNMPFFDNELVFIFNGELRGVKIKEKGRIGAEKIFNIIKKFNNKNLLENISSTINLLETNSDYIKAINLIISDKEKIYISSFFNEMPEYFTMHFLSDKNIKIICSDPIFEGAWKKIDNKNVMEIQ